MYSLVINIEVNGMKASLILMPNMTKVIVDIESV